MTRLMKKIFLLTAALLILCSLSAQNSINLRLNPEKNKPYRFAQLSEQTVLQTVNGNQQTVESKVKYVVSIKMMDATASFIVAEIRFDTISIKTNTMGKTVNMTSSADGDIKSKETSDIMSYVLNRLSKNPVYAKIDYTGKVTDIINGKMLSDMIMKDTNAVTVTGPMGSAIKAQIGNQVSSNTLKTMVEGFTHFLPGKEISGGDSWTVSESTSSGGMSLDISTVFHLDGTTDDNANLSAEVSIKATPNAAPMKAGAGTITYDDIKGLGKSTLVVDRRTGLMIESGSQTRITGNLGFSMPGMSMQIPMDITSSSKIAAIK